MLRLSSKTLSSLCFCRNKISSNSRLLVGYPGLRGQCIVPNINTSQRLSISQASKHIQGDQPPDKKEFTVIYRLPYIRHLRILSRLKLAQTIFVVGIVPPLGYLKYIDMVTNVQLILPVAVATFALVMLYAMSFYLRRIIGIMYISQDGTKLKIAHLNFWGRRRDLVVEVNNVLSNLEIGDSREVLLRKFQTFDSKNHLYFTLKYGQIVNKTIFYEIFGKPQ